MPVIRCEKNDNYTSMSNIHLRDKKLSLKAKGLLSFMLSLPDEWDYSLNGLCSLCKEQKNTITNTLNELKDSGYLTVDKIRNDKGHYEYVYTIYERPNSSPGVEKPGMDNPDMENYTQINTNIINTKKINTPYNPPKGDGGNTGLFDKFWSEYPRKVSKGNAEKWFKKNKPTKELVDLMIEKIKQLKETKQWKSDNGKFIPYPASWLNAKGWEDELECNDILSKYDTNEIFFEECVGQFKLDENGGRIYI